MVLGSARIGVRGYSCQWNACEDASSSNHLRTWLVKAVEALAGVDEIMALDKELFFLEPVQCVPHGP